ncbi:MULTISPECIES: lytic polysaccharide monooxygenase [Paenibacillus]|uniref:Chitin-binding protein n=1 Tax=Paenibacillus campinasensis TaxID=66347 RepID=A0ABW9SXB1_9BACL|nr:MULTISPECIES: lytic polysaccharide monooxygenase [Paenibacillus]MUG65474.1 chitin-binding protein [Paenibacillus campinasensis]PAK51465.1 chitin-binding protein [Paenibacillus sp. 7541]
MTLRLPNQAWMKKLVAVGLMTILMGVIMVIFADKVSAHGYVESPASRAYLCKEGQNSDCGNIIYEPQSLEAPKGWPNAGPADGQIASAGGLFPKLDEQSSTRWAKVNITPGTTTFQWRLTAAHATASWKYYITKDGWNPNAPLSRASFDLTPFCSIDYGGVRPPANYASTCNVPAKTGYHVILAVWEVADTANAFYNVIDVNFVGGGGNPDPGLQAPTGLTSTARTNSSISLAWNASSGAARYEVYRGGSLVGTSTSTSYTDSGLTAGTSYTYTVVAVNSAGSKSAASAPLTVSTTGSSTTYPAWSATTTYWGGDRVTYNGLNYEARWWTLGETPGSAYVWMQIP